MVHLSIRILEQDVDWQCLATILHVVAWIEYSWVCLLLKCLTSHLHYLTYLTSTKIHPKSKKKNVFLSNNLRFSQKTQQPWHQWCHGTGDHLSLDDAFSVHLGPGVFVQPPKKGGVINKMGKNRKQRLKIFSIVSWGWNWDHQFLQLNHLEGIETLKIWRKNKYTKSAERNGKPTSWSDPQKSGSSWAPTVFKPG